MKPQLSSTLQCATIAGVTGVREGNICTATGPIGPTFYIACHEAGGMAFPTGTGLFGCTYPATEVPGQCPAGTTTSNGQCITKPGQGNRP